MTEKKSHILVFQIPDSGLKTIKLTKPAYTIGRAEKANICIEHPSCSRHHATLLRVEAPNGDYYQLIDGNPRKDRRSANGVFVNSERVESYLLDHKDCILFGNQQVKATYLCVSRACISRSELQTITVENSRKEIDAGDVVVAIAPDGEAVLLRERPQS